MGGGGRPKQRVRVVPAQDLTGLHLLKEFSNKEGRAVATQRKREHIKIDREASITQRRKEEGSYCPILTKMSRPPADKEQGEKSTKIRNH